LLNANRAKIRLKQKGTKESLQLREKKALIFICRCPHVPTHPNAIMMSDQIVLTKQQKMTDLYSKLLELFLWLVLWK